MEIYVIDGLGGGIGKSIISAIKTAYPEYTVIGLGTNSMASSAMKKAGANIVATGENAIIYNAKKAKIIVGPMRLVIGNSMHGEITPAMASAISESTAQKYLIPISNCSITVLGTVSKSIQECIQDLVNEIPSTRV